MIKHQIANQLIKVETNDDELKRDLNVYTFKVISKKFCPHLIWHQILPPAYCLPPNMYRKCEVSFAVVMYTFIFFPIYQIPDPEMRV